MRRCHRPAHRALGRASFSALSAAGGRAYGNYAVGYDNVDVAADCVSIHTVLDPGTRHMIDADRLRQTKRNAILVNTSRGPVIDEAALVAHCRNNPHFRAALDVFEDEPNLSPGLADLENVVIVPHIASATVWTRRARATLAAANVAALLQGYPAWQRSDMAPFLADSPPKAAPSIVNAEAPELSFGPQRG